jgi:putative NADPH-quinone reductase
VSQKILVILGHPNSQSFCQALVEQYVFGAQSRQKEVRVLTLNQISFDPVLHGGYNRDQVLEPELIKAQQDILWADHLTFVYPIWWGGIPALLKGFIDRTFLPGFAFKYHQNDPWWDRLLKGRSADLLVTMDTPPWYFRWVSKMPGHNQMKKTILEFCGVKPVKIKDFGAVRTATPEQKEKWLRQANVMGQNA